MLLPGSPKIGLRSPVWYSVSVMLVTIALGTIPTNFNSVFVDFSSSVACVYAWWAKYSMPQRSAQATTVKRKFKHNNMFLVLFRT